MLEVTSTFTVWTQAVVKLIFKKGDRKIVLIMDISTELSMGHTKSS